MAEREGFRALYLSGGGVAAVLGMPDLAITDAHDVTAAAAAITAVTPLPLLVDIDTGFGTWLNLARTIKMLEDAGVAAVHLEDQVQAKRCGHRPNKQLVEAGEMRDRIIAAVDARRDDSFVIMARTDALASEPMDAVLARVNEYVNAGADMIFLEAAKTLDDYRAVKDACAVPLLANITEFGQTPLFSADELASAGVDIMLFPLSAFRAMNKAALTVYQAIRKDRSQRGVLDFMQTREELYDFLGYYQVEQKMDSLFNEKVNTNPSKEKK